MVEAISLSVAVIALIQTAGQVISFCKFYIETVHNAPSDLRSILIETSTTKSVLESLQFLISCKSGLLEIPGVLSSVDGAIEQLKSTITEIERLFPSNFSPTPEANTSKREHVKSILTALRWPLKENKARKLVEEMRRCKDIINLALTTESL
jgi:hypothetical protein